uniref:Sterol-C5-desaturase n=1 Tax=Calidris pygmaea TaxID=425635 RepID=A0A8C3PLI7_9CHAR
MPALQKGALAPLTTVDGCCLVRDPPCVPSPPRRWALPLHQSLSTLPTLQHKPRPADRPHGPLHRELGGRGTSPPAPPCLHAAPRRPSRPTPASPGKAVEYAGRDPSDPSSLFPAGRAMDLVLDAADRHLLTPYVYPAGWPEGEPCRQLLSLFVITNLGALALYLLFGTLSYYFIFDHRLKQHPQFLENQVRREITYALRSLPWISVPTVALFFAEVRGYSKLYDNIEDSPYGWTGVFLSMLSFLFFTDMGIYWIHRGLHHKLFYKRFHKPHHLWKIATPFASHAFHPVDGFMQSLPYHVYPFLFPLHKVTYLGLYIFVNVWTISIHDGDYRVPRLLRHVINGSAHHTDHHLYFDYNYGQYFTLWDKIGGSYKSPTAFEGKGPHDYLRQLREKAAGAPNGSPATKTE